MLKLCYFCYKVASFSGAVDFVLFLWEQFVTVLCECELSLFRPTMPTRNKKSKDHKIILSGKKNMSMNLN